MAMFSGEYARSCNSSLLVAYSWSIFTVLQHSPWIVIWLRQFQTVQNYRHASSISLQFFTDGGGFVDFIAPSYPNSQASSLFFIVRQLSFEDCRLKDKEQTTIFAAGKPCIVAPEEYATRPRRYSSLLSANEKRMSQ